MRQTAEKTAHAAARWQFYRERLRQKGLLWVFTRIAKRIGMALAWLILLPLTLLLHVAGFRRVTIFTDRIGHLAAEVDSFLKEQALGRLPVRRWFILAPPHRVSNRHLLAYWQPHVVIVATPWLCALLGIMTWWRKLMVFDISHYVLGLNMTASYYAVNAAWGARPPLLQLSAADRARGAAVLASMGLPPQAWFVCVHAREGGFSPADEILHAHRNSEVMRLLPAIEEIIGRGGWCIQVGDPSSRPLPPRHGIIDYAHHAARSDWMDIFLCASCRFFLGNSSGLFVVSNVFGVPCALANMIPLSALGYAPKDISIPKLLRRAGQDGHLPFGEIFNSPLADYRLAKLYQDAGIEVEENSAEEILDLAKEMLDGLDCKLGYSAEDERLQQRFRALFRPGHYAYGAASRTGAAFLRKYQQLLP